ISLTMQSADGQALPTALPGQYIVLRLQRTGGVPPLFRCYSFSDAPSTERYRISVKIEPNGVAGTYLRDHVRVSDALDVSAPRGSFILQSGERPIVLLSAGIGVTPVLAMLHALAAARSTRQVLGARGSRWATSSICRRSSPPHARAPARPQLCLLQQTGFSRQSWRKFRRYWSSIPIGLRRVRHFTRSGCLSLWADS